MIWVLRCRKGLKGMNTSKIKKRLAETLEIIPIEYKSWKVNFIQSYGCPRCFKCNHKEGSLIDCGIENHRLVFVRPELFYMVDDWCEKIESMRIDEKITQLLS
jgi:multimeric flavodoxin WrbA